MSDAVAKIEQAPAPAAQPESSALISMIERAARDPNVDIDKMERLFQMHERVAAQQAKAAYLSALSLMQSDLPAAMRRGKGHNDKKYARFEDIIGAIRPILSTHGFSLSFRTTQDDKLIRVTGVLGHSAGHSEQTEMAMPPDTSGNKNIVQAWGSSTSYGKRYVALTLLGIASEDEDDDAKKAIGLITPDQTEELARLITATNTKIQAVLDFHKVESLSDMTAADYREAKAMLVARKAKINRGQNNG